MTIGYLAMFGSVRRQFCTLTLVYTSLAWIALLTACSAYNPKLIDRFADSSKPKVEAGSIDTGKSPNYTDAGSTDGPVDRKEAGSPSDGGDTDDAGDEDASCTLNPNPTTECPQICEETCNGKDDDCDGKTDEGDPSLMCSVAHATALCQEGNCLIDECVKSFHDCDKKPGNGCEASFDDVATCGVCDQNCDTKLANTAETSCAPDGTCTIMTCASGFEDCDAEDDNGCERDTAVQGSCAPDTNCTKRLYNDNEYFFCTKNSIWTLARNKCQVQKRGDLVHIDDEDENEFVKTHSGNNSWIGANDRTHEGLWQWSNNGVPFWLGSQTGTTLLSQYASWSGDQPDNATDTADCGEILDDGTWNDTKCDNLRDFVCEVSPDLCPNDANKHDPGQCGCDTPDTDTDGDGFASCNDACPKDPEKTVPGICGCGTADSNTNSDGDSELDCIEECDDDPNKLEPGLCGCGVVDDNTDSDGDGTADCIDDCPLNASSTDATTGCGLGFVPVNIDVTVLNPDQADAPVFCVLECCNDK